MLLVSNQSDRPPQVLQDLSRSRSSYLKDSLYSRESSPVVWGTRRKYGNYDAKKTTVWKFFLEYLIYLSMILMVYDGLYIPKSPMCPMYGMLWNSYHHLPFKHDPHTWIYNIHEGCGIYIYIHGMRPLQGLP